MRCGRRRDCGEKKIKKPPKARGDLLAGGLLLVTDTDKLAIVGGVGIVSLAKGSPAPGVRSWIVTFDASLETPLLLAFGQQVQDYRIPFFAARMRYISSSPIVAEFFLVDAAGTPIDPCTTFAAAPGDNIVQFSVFRAGTGMFVVV